MLAVMLAVSLDYFPEAGSGTPSPPSLPAPQVPDPARALLDAPTPENARAFLAWQEAEADRLKAAIRAIEAARGGPPESPPPRRARGDLLARFRR